MLVINYLQSNCKETALVRKKGSTGSVPCPQSAGWHCLALRTEPAPRPGPELRPASSDAGGWLPAQGQVGHTRLVTGERARVRC